MKCVELLFIRYNYQLFYLYLFIINGKYIKNRTLEYGNDANKTLNNNFLSQDTIH